MSPPATEDRELRALTTLGLARRADRVAIGTRAVKQAAAAGELRVVLVAADAGPGARKRLGAVLRLEGVDVLRVGSRRRLGRALGRDDLVVAGVTDEGFAALLAERLPLDRGAAPDRPRGQRDVDENGAGRTRPEQRRGRNSEAARQG
jgi:ribosomal protein L7Ae-like RNA K-turn-binding protein